MESKKSLLQRWTAYAVRVGLVLSLRAGIGALVIALKLKSLMAEDSTRQAVLLILLLLGALSVLVLFQTLSSWGSVESALQRDLSM